MSKLDLIRAHVERGWQQWRHHNKPQSLDLVGVAYRLAAEESARYQVQHMRSVPDYISDLALHRAVSQGSAPGCLLEFGVASGRTLRNLAQANANKPCWGFDSWQGLPEDWTWLFPRGSFRQGIPQRMPGNVHLIQGLFSDTLPEFVRTNSDHISIIHIDCDLKSSTDLVLETLHDRIQPGCRIIFDEYMNYPGWQWDEHAAWQQYVQRYDREYRYIGRVSRHQQVAVEVLR